eukprot:6504114-Heterocapsa_arctica.AAC.1
MIPSSEIDRHHRRSEMQSFNVWLYSGRCVCGLHSRSSGARPAPSRVLANNFFVPPDLMSAIAFAHGELHTNKDAAGRQSSEEVI